MLAQSLASGLDQFLTPLTLALSVLGIVFGLAVGAMPGLGPLMGIVLMLPFAVDLPPVAAMGFLISILVGGSCGGSISAILLRIPGTPLAAATLFDGYPMSVKGRSADAVGIAISASALGGLAGGIVLIFTAPVLAGFASNFAAPEYAMLALTGLIAIAVVSDGSLLKGLISGSLGLLIATVGTDQFSTGYRFTFGMYEMLNGFHLVAIVVGIFAISEMTHQVYEGGLNVKPNVQIVRPGFRTIVIVLRHWRNLIRSSGIGAAFGALPGVGGVISSFASYAVAKAFSRPEEGYGEGAEGGIIAAESANNASVGGALVPTMALGIPGDAGTAVLIGAMLILGFFPGPALFAQQPEIAGGVLLVYLFSNVALLIVGIMATPVFVWILRLKKSYLIPVVLLLCAIGTFALQSSVFDLWVMLGFGIVGIILRYAGYPLAPLVIGVVLGPLLENNLRRALLISREGYWIFLDRPVSAVLVGANVLLIAGAIYWTVRRRRDRQAVAETGE
jgi:putative tricarboxylic transport membrane protein